MFAEQIESLGSKIYITNRLSNVYDSEYIYHIGILNGTSFVYFDGFVHFVLAKRSKSKSV